MIALVMVPMAMYAQIRIIPQDKIRQAATPTHIAQVGVEIEGGGVIDLGLINESDEPHRTLVRWSNNSGQSVAITRIRSGCGCLVANHDSKPVGSGENGEIELAFNPKGRSGAIRHRVYLYTTLSEDAPSAVVEVIGRVTTAGIEDPQWPHSAGTLQLRTRKITLGKGEQSVRIAVRNGGSVPLVVVHDSKLSSQGVEAHTEPKVLQPTEEGDLVVTIKDSEATAMSPVVMLFLGGVDAPPRERRIEIEK